MNLDSHEIKQLGEFFARRFPEPHRRAAFAAAARVRYTEDGTADPVHGWEDLIAAAQAARRLPSLIRVAAAEAPDDENLQHLTAMFAGQSRLARRVAASAAVGAGLGAAALVALVTMTGVLHTPQDAPALTQAAPLSVGVPVADAAPVGAGPALVPNVIAAAQRPESAEPAQAEADEAEPTNGQLVATVQPVPQAAPPAASTTGWTGTQVAWTNGRCTTAKAGEVVGYWYAGAKQPGGSGDVISIQESVNVRADYPDKHNDYDARSSIRCVLRAGDQVRLSDDPIKVPGDRYWVPLATGDLLVDDADGSASL